MLLINSRKSALTTRILNTDCPHCLNVMEQAVNTDKSSGPVLEDGANDTCTSSQTPVTKPPADQTTDNIVEKYDQAAETYDQVNVFIYLCCMLPKSVFI